MKTKGLAIGCFLLACCVLGYLKVEHYTVLSIEAPRTTAQTASVQPVSPPLPVREVIPVEEPGPIETVVSVPVVEQVVEPVAKTNANPPNPSNQPVKKTKKELQDPMARMALSLVGTADPDAEAYWLGAIFDSSLPDNEREDLMEDLNEEGFADPKHPSPEELPLIVNRLQMIEEVAPHADEFMQNHLAEAYKDLVNLLNGKGPQ